MGHFQIFCVVPYTTVIFVVCILLLRIILMYTILYIKDKNKHRMMIHRKEAMAKFLAKIFSYKIRIPTPTD